MEVIKLNDHTVVNMDVWLDSILKGNGLTCVSHNGSNPRIYVGKGIMVKIETNE